MNRSETLKILAVLKVAYPSSYRNMSKDELNALVLLWTEMFSDEDYMTVNNAVKSYIAVNENGFAPSIGQVKSLMHREQGMTPQEASSILVKAISRSGWHAQEEFDKLPDTIQQVVKTPDMLREWSKMEASVVNSVIVSNFQRSYKDVVENEIVNRKLPKALRDSRQEVIEGYGERLKLVDR